MDQKEILDMVVSERIDLLLTTMHRMKQRENDETAQLMEDAEALLKRMPREEWIIITRYMERHTDRLTDDAVYLYSCGIKDGDFRVNYFSLTNFLHLDNCFFTLPEYGFYIITRRKKVIFGQKKLCWIALFFEQLFELFLKSLCHNNKQSTQECHFYKVFTAYHPLQYTF